MAITAILNGYRAAVLRLNQTRFFCMVKSPTVR